MTVTRGPAVTRFGTLAALLAAEFLLALASGWLYPPLYQLDQRLGWVHTPGLDRAFADESGRAVRFATDARGLRGTPWPAARAPVCFGVSVLVCPQCAGPRQVLAAKRCRNAVGVVCSRDCSRIARSLSSTHRRFSGSAPRGTRLDRPQDASTDTDIRGTRDSRRLTRRARRRATRRLQ